ncbi:MAG: hypothetical protein M1118_10100 [Chloroflexi bacterium]|nr:hypothetical protein [Chloroflexota bacterium]
MAPSQQEYYRGIRMAPYDLVKEALIAFGVVLMLVLVLAAVFSSADEPPLTIQQVAQQMPRTFLGVALGDLDGRGKIASYGPPYNHGTGSVQYLGPISLQELAGVQIPVNTKQDFVLAPLQEVARNDPAVKALLQQFQAAPAQQQSWEAAYAQALKKATRKDGTVIVPAGPYGPVGPMLMALLRMGQSGGLDGYLLTTPHFYQTDYTKTLLFIQGKPLHAKSRPLHLLDTQWGMMNETGSWPGQEWLWLYAIWYQVPIIATSPNIDVYTGLIMAVLTALFILVPYLPGINRLPRVLGVYKLIWRDYYREQRATRHSRESGAVQP